MGARPPHYGSYGGCLTWLHARDQLTLSFYAATGLMKILCFLYAQMRRTVSPLLQVTQLWLLPNAVIVSIFRTSVPQELSYATGVT